MSVQVCVDGNESKDVHFDNFFAGVAAFGWFVTRVHDYPEPEGIVWLPLNRLPRRGDKLKMPSDGHECVVSTDNEFEGTLSVKE